MRHIYQCFLVLFFSVFLSLVYAETPIQRESSHIRQVLTNWDEKKGEWLYQSIDAIVMGTPFPDRSGKIAETPFELLNLMTENRFNRVYRIVERELEQERKERESDTLDLPYYWEQWLMVLNRTSCGVQSGRSNGDPHMLTFDGKRYDFQNAGDYLLTSSLVTDFDIQTRQVRFNENISVNGAMAVNLNGDTVTVYAQSAPDSINGRGFFINRTPVELGEEPIYLERGGIIRYEYGRYVLNAPTGEQVHFKIRTFSNTDLLDIDVFVPSCNSDVIGLLGDADGNPENDIRTYNDSLMDAPDRSYDAVFGSQRNSDSQRLSEANYLRFIAEDFGTQFEMDSLYNLFESPWLDLTDEERYPKIHLSLADLSDEQIEEGLKTCRAHNILEEDLMACVYDLGYVGLDPDLPASYTGNAGTRKQGSIMPTHEKETTPRNQQNRPTIRTRTIPIFGVPPVRTSPPRQTTPNRTPSSAPAPTRIPRGR